MAMSISFGISKDNLIYLLKSTINNLTVHWQGSCNPPSYCLQESGKMTGPLQEGSNMIMVNLNSDNFYKWQSPLQYQSASHWVGFWMWAETAKTRRRIWSLPLPKLRQQWRQRHCLQRELIRLVLNEQRLQSIPPGLPRRESWRRQTFLPRCFATRL